LRFSPCGPGEVPPKTGMKAAVVGAGPAGLARPVNLRVRVIRLRSTIGSPEPGGMITFTIPTSDSPRRGNEGIEQLKS